jgi:hypothetical protein
MNHPCHNFSCPEYNQGQCFGGGCKSNPMPEREDDNENENTQEDNQ